MTHPLPRPLASLVLAAAAGVASAGETEASYTAALLAGFDTNPLLVTGDGPNGVNGHLRFEGSVLHTLGSGSAAALFADGRAASRFEESRTEPAEQTSGELRGGLALTPALGTGRLAISAGGRVAAYRGTFIDRTTGEAYRASVSPPTDPPSSIPIPDRLNFDATGGFLNLRWRQASRWSVFTFTSFDKTHFIEDYATTTDLDALDYSALTIRPGASVKLARAVALDLHVARTIVEYDHRLALDESGTEVPGATREDELTQYGATLTLVPGPGWKLDLGLTAIGREDTYAGYYDSDGAAGAVALDRELSPRSGLRVYGSMRDLEYDRATVTGDPSDPDLLGTVERRWAARFTHGFGGGLSLQVETGTQTTDSEDPVFAYDRDWVYTGIEFTR